MAKPVQLTEHVMITSGAHILYTYDDLGPYIDNAVSFIITGLQQGQHILYIDSSPRYELVMEKLRERGFEHKPEWLLYVDNQFFYRTFEAFSAKEVHRQFTELLQPLLDSGTPVRTWGHVEWNRYLPNEEELVRYERKSDETVGQVGVLTVCVYSGRQLSASLQTQLMETHEYVMTDRKLTRSSLYEKTGCEVIFPSLSEHAKMQSEVDLYKKKLDFVQVISHEVRNPLTVIKAYASMLLHDAKSLQPGGNAVNKLSGIVDYVAVIDNEIAHILNTEQMLSSEALWKTSAVSPLPVLQEVVTMMEIKARTQNMKLVSSIMLDGSEVMCSNVIGLRLVVSNLLSNAVKYSFEGSEILFCAHASEGMLRIGIKDHGVGMSRDQLANLYRKYEKMNVNQSGQGIGLFMVKKLVDHFGGDIQMMSEVDQGTTVRIWLPLTGAAPQ